MFPRLRVQDSGLDRCSCDVKHLHFPACFSLCYSLLHQCISLCRHEYLRTLNIWSILLPAAISHCRLLLRWPFRVHINGVVLQLSPSHTLLHSGSAPVVKSDLKLSPVQSHVSQKEGGWIIEEKRDFPVQPSCFTCSELTQNPAATFTRTLRHAATCNSVSANSKQPNGVSESHLHYKRQCWGLHLFLFVCGFSL